MAAELNTYAIHTTREQIPDGEYLYFTESHSHATEQKLVKNGLEEILEQTDRVVFAEDEVTTGNTIRKIILLMRETYGEHLRFSAASLSGRWNRPDLSCENGLQQLSETGRIL